MTKNICTTCGDLKPTNDWCIMCKCRGCQDNGNYIKQFCRKANDRVIYEGVPYIGSMTMVRPPWCPGFVSLDAECNCEDISEDPFQRIHVGVPIVIKPGMTFGEVINELNKQAPQGFFKNKDGDEE